MSSSVKRDKTFNAVTSNIVKTSILVINEQPAMPIPRAPDGAVLWLSETFGPTFTDSRGTNFSIAMTQV